MDINSIIVSIIVNTCMIIGVVMYVIINRGIDRRSNGYFLSCMLMVLLLMFFDVWELALSYAPTPSVYRNIATAMGYILRAVAVTLLYEFLNKKGKRSYTLWIADGIIAFSCFINIFTHWIWCYDAANQFVKGPLRLLPLLILGFCAVVVIIKSAMDYKELKIGEKSVVAFAIAVSVMGGLVECLLSIKLLFAGCLMVSCTLYYIIVNKYQEAKKARDYERELADGRIKIMLSQIQPHFLYNTLSSIRSLCRRDPAMAEQATIELTEFLRGNMDSLSADKPISFEQELAHTKNYLALEEIRFPKKLNIVYDIETTAFRLPTLTLQPIVENAVRYGVTKRVEGGTVTITTRETDEAFLICVIDDGVGFDPMQPKEDGRTHIGISNVQSRLKTMCGGSLRMESTPHVGTSACITIPKEKTNVDLYCGR